MEIYVNGGKVMVKIPRWSQQVKKIRVYDQFGILQFVLYPQHLGKIIELPRNQEYRFVTMIGGHMVQKTIEVP